MSACRRAGEQQVGDVGAGDQQNERDDDKNREERALVSLTQSRRARSRLHKRKRLFEE